MEILLTVYRIQLFIQMTQIEQSRSNLWINLPVYRELFVFVGIC